MADICMCSNTLCPLAGTCWRVQAPANVLWQTMFSFQYTVGTNGPICESYIETVTSIATEKTQSDGC